MKPEEFLQLAEELNKSETSVARRTEILTTMNATFKEVTDNVAALEEDRNKLTAQVNDISHANSLLFRKLGLTVTETEEKAKEKELAETITLEQIEGGSL